MAIGGVVVVGGGSDDGGGVCSIGIGGMCGVVLLLFGFGAIYGRTSYSEGKV